MTTAQKQGELLDALEASVRFAETAAASTGDPADETDTTDVFRYQVSALDPASEEFGAVVTRYDETKQDVHSWSRKRPARVFKLEDARHGAEVAATAKRLRNVRRMWHGTGAANVLSILSRGLFIPPTTGSGIHIAGRMFGDGIYMSRSASKSLGYSVGYWGGGSATSSFIFLAGVAMGHEYRPDGNVWGRDIAVKARTGKGTNGKAYNSINVEPGKAGVRNHEAIVWDAMQVELRYLVEFED